MHYNSRSAPFRILAVNPFGFEPGGSVLGRGETRGHEPAPQFSESRSWAVGADVGYLLRRRLCFSRRRPMEYPHLVDGSGSRLGGGGGGTYRLAFHENYTEPA